MVECISISISLVAVQKIAIKSPSISVSFLLIPPADIEPWSLTGESGWVIETSRVKDTV
jgi:hypothetical protein